MQLKKINSFEDACKILNRDTCLPDFSMVPEKDRKAIIAHYKLTVICAALNEGWVPDWNNGKYDKWFPWFYMNNKGSSGRFSFGRSGDRRSGSIVGSRLSLSSVGSRLCFKSREISDFAGRQFEDLYRDYFLIE